KDIAGARRAWERALQLDPSDVDAMNGLTGLSLAARKPAEARAFVDRRLSRASDDPDLLLLSAKLYLIERDNERAEADLKRLLHVDPTNLQAYGLLGDMYVREHKVADAKREFATLVARDPDSVSAQTMMGLLCEEQGDIDGAIVWYERAVRTDNRAA